MRRAQMGVLLVLALAGVACETLLGADAYKTDGASPSALAASATGSASLSATASSATSSGAGGAMHSGTSSGTGGLSVAVTPASVTLLAQTTLTFSATGDPDVTWT